jgi:hypothetical protein
MPFTVQTLKRDKIFNTTDVMQSSLDPFLEPLSPTFFLPNTNAALATFRLTKLLPSGQTVLGANFGQVLGDSDTCCRLLHHSSFIYSDGVMDHLPFSDWPVYSPSIALGTSERTELSQSQILKFLKPTDFKVAFGEEARVKADYEVMTVSFSPKEIVAMKREVKEGGLFDASSTDVTTAWWITLLERGGEVPFRTVFWVINVSETHGHQNIPNVDIFTLLSFGNCIPSTLAFPSSLCNLAAMLVGITNTALPVLQDPYDPISRMSQVARSSRSRLVEMKNDPESYLTDLRAEAWILKDAAMQGKGQSFNQPEGAAYTNSLLS